MYRGFFNKDTANSVSQVPVIIACFVLTAHICLALVILILIYRSKRGTVHILAANCIGAGLFFSLFVRPGTIRLGFQFLPVSEGYCWLHIFLSQIEMFVIPWTMFMFTIDRLRYIRAPTSYGQKDSRAGLIAMLVVPWAIAICIMSIITALEQGEIVTSGQMYSNLTYYGCHAIAIPNAAHETLSKIYVFIFCGLVPMFISMIVAIVSLGMWCCFRRRQARDTVYALQDSEVVQIVRDSVIAVVVLNILYSCVLFLRLSMMPSSVVGSAILSRLCYIVLSMTGCIVWMTTLPGMRYDMKTLCCRRNHLPTSQVSFDNSQPHIVGIENVSAPPEK